MIQNTMGQLPYNPTQPERNQLQGIGPENPPAVPQIPVDPQLAGYLPAVSGAVAVEIQATANLNSPRMFMFNQMSVNNFANGDFQSLVLGVFDYVAAAMMKRIYPNVEAAFQDAITRVTQAYAAFNIRQYPALQQYVDAQQMQSWGQSLTWYDGVRSEIEAMKRNMQNQPMGGGFAGGQQGNWGNQGGGNAGTGWSNRWSGGSGGGQQNLGGYSSQFNLQPQRATGTVSAFGGSRAVMSGTQGSGQVGRDMGGGGRYSSPPSASFQPQATAAQDVLRQPFTSKEPPVQQNELQAPAPDQQVAQEVPAAGNLSMWRPSQKYPYLPAYNPAKQVLYFLDEGAGVIQPILKPKDSQVDYDRHATNATFGPVPATVNLSDPAAVLGRIDDGVKQLKAEQAAPRQTQGPEFKNRDALIKTGTICETSEAMAIFQGSVSLAMVQKVPDIYRACARVAEPVVSKVDESSLVEDYAKSTSFNQLRDKLNATAASATPAMWHAANNKATALINRLLKQNLSLPDWAIGSFVLDYAELVALLRQTYGDAIPAALEKHQADNIKANFQLMYADTAKTMTDTFLEDYKPPEGKEAPQITYLSSDLSLTYLNCLAHELDIELNSATLGAAVSQENTPELYALLEDLFKYVEANGGDFDRHLIITNDTRILEASQGYLGDGVYILTLIK